MFFVIAEPCGMHREVAAAAVFEIFGRRTLHGLLKDAVEGTDGGKSGGKCSIGNTVAVVEMGAGVTDANKMNGFGKGHGRAA